MSKHCGQFSLIGRATALLFLTAACFGKLNAQIITLYNNPSAGQQSYVEVSIGSTVSDADVNSLPYLTPASTQDSDFNSSILTNDLTTSGLSFGYSEVSISDDVGSRGPIYFQAGAGVTYSITGSFTASGDGEGVGYIELHDVTEGLSNLYFSGDTVDGSGTYVFGSSTDGGQSPSGELTAGDVYSFFASAGASNTVRGPESLSGNFDISFAQEVPEPSTYAMLLVGMVFLLFWGRRKLA